MFRPFRALWGEGGVVVNPGLTPWAIKSVFADLCKAFSLYSATIIMFVIIVVVHLKAHALDYQIRFGGFV